MYLSNEEAKIIVSDFNEVMLNNEYFEFKKNEYIIEYQKNNIIFRECRIICVK